MRAALPNRQTGVVPHAFRGSGRLGEARSSLKSTPGYLTPPCSGQDLVKIAELRGRRAEVPALSGTASTPRVLASNNIATVGSFTMCWTEEEARRACETWFV